MILTNTSDNLADTVESFFIDLKYNGIYRSWSIHKTKLATDRASAPLMVSTFSHFAVIEEHVNKIATDYES
ncbi:256_t:CDS:2 [Entrophospora sp. SA101]|nr:8068_t:CDS:2 [Entrophospora sp. SA101]CAJ0627669.1 256_t:CDS:2 [Entrophospora sp. SA101]CAJ0839644.1 2678_t:CDS:2 [Entrophospora sp. SA101]CAJ0849282.1 15226_t:CDS:2 [Entrophospora sp. SA101]